MMAALCNIRFKEKGIPRRVIGFVQLQIGFLRIVNSKIAFQLIYDIGMIRGKLGKSSFLKA
jgi:hypothetical protein